MHMLTVLLFPSPPSLSQQKREQYLRSPPYPGQSDRRRNISEEKQRYTQEAESCAQNSFFPRSSLQSLLQRTPLIHAQCWLCWISIALSVGIRRGRNTRNFEGRQKMLRTIRVHVERKRMKKRTRIYLGYQPLILDYLGTLISAFGANATSRCRLLS
jgi:hypothetical protein